MAPHIIAITVKRIAIKRIMFFALKVFSLKTERIKVVIICLLWDDLLKKGFLYQMY
jgi:hypothetical protein